MVPPKLKRIKDLGGKRRTNFLCDKNLLKCPFMTWREQKLEENNHLI